MAIVNRGLAEAGLDFEISITQARGHAADLAEAARSEEWPAIVVVGGDGTINEVVNGLMRSRPTGAIGPLGLIPLGTANDLATMLDLPADPRAACRRIGQGRLRLIDLGQVNDQYFVNNSAVGLEPMVAIAYEQIRWLKGDFRYIVAALWSILWISYWKTNLTWDSGALDDSMTIISVGNSPRTGGAFYMTPKARLDDGQLDFIHGPKMSRLQLLKLLPQTFKGRHIDHPLVTYAQSAALSITASPATPIQADGEIIDRHATEIRYRILPRKLQVII